MERSQEAHRSPAIQVAFASHKPLMSGGAAVAATPPASSLASVLEPLPAVDVSSDVAATIASPASPSQPVPSAQAAEPLEPPARAEVRELLELFMSPGDGRVSVALQRYLKGHGWQLAWEIDRDFPIEYPATFTGDFLGIVEQIVVSLQNTDAPIRVKVYEANRVLRVVHATQ
ncbi:toxin co-regulated pilus biosynthesis Q family protein [Pandoraea horticolens]|uniref:toxin co-regulated pilus biosynthesis Q family protein n=1 Tax=Pandoraea horticolens TaxID=2508298 RepID=UPI001583E03E|nr:toxin co-regulated pilus biosynthesis Q family protein [Pandoraea horticolens]